MLDIGPFKTVPLSDEEEIGAMMVARLKQIYVRSVDGSDGVHYDVRSPAYKFVKKRVCEMSTDRRSYNNLCRPHQRMRLPSIPCPSHVPRQMSDAANLLDRFCCQNPPAGIS